MTNHQSDLGASLEREDGQSSDETASDLKDLVLTPAAPMDDLVAEQGPAFKASAIDSHMDPPESIESKGLLAVNEAALASEATVEATPWHSKLRTTLYQRSEEETILHRAFHRSIESSDEVIFISGPEGTGKTRLAKSLEALVGDGYFLTGKFDQLRRAAPYTAYVHAFTDLTYQVKRRGQAEVDRMKAAIEEAVGAEKSILTGMIPALEELVGRPEESKTNQGPSNKGDSLLLFTNVFSRFIRSISSPERPLVLFLDDLQFADPCSLDVFHLTATDHQTRGLVLVGSCDDSVQPGSYLAGRLRDMEDQGKTKITSIALTNFAEEEIRNLLNDTFLLGTDQCEALTKLVHTQTKGNVFHMIEFLRWLQEKDILTKASHGWEMDSDEAAMVVECAPREFLLDKLRKLPTPAQDVLKVAACLGSVINQQLVQYVVGVEPSGTLFDLQRRGLLTRNPADLYEFEHDGIQDAAYQLIPENELELFHLKVGRRIWRNLAKEELDIHIFSVVSQLKLGSRLIQDGGEQVAVGILCLHAGQQAARASTFRTAAIYLDMGLGLMDETRWRSDYDLMLALHNASAEMKLCTSDFDRMNDILEEALLHARVFEDSLQAYTTRMYALTSQDRQAEAIELGMKILDGLGEGLPRRSNKMNIILEYRKVQKLLRGKSDEHLLRTKIMNDEVKLRVLQILNMLILPVTLVRPDLAPFVILKSMNITLRHGLSALSPTAFAIYGMFLIVASSPKEADRFAKLALVLLDRFKAVQYLPQVYVVVFGTIRPWLYPIEECLEPLIEASRVGLRVGDYVYGSLCASQYHFLAMDAGISLQLIDKQWQHLQASMTTKRQRMLLRLILPSVQDLNFFLGHDDPVAFKGSLMNFEEGLQEAKNDDSLFNELGIKFCWMGFGVVYFDFEQAYKHRLSFDEIDLMPLTLERSTSVFNLGLICVEMARRAVDTRQNIGIVKRALVRIRKWSRACPQNFVDKVFLLEAELLSFQKKDDLAYEKYICAIGMAEANNFPHIAGFAKERLGWHLHRKGEQASARWYWEDARDSYRVWGATTKVQQMDEMLLQQG